MKVQSSRPRRCANTVIRGLTAKGAAVVYRTDRTCDFLGCEGKHKAQGWCLAHYQQIVMRGEQPAPIKSRGTLGRTCAIEGCDSTNYSRHMCIKHYQRWRKSGSTDVPLTKSQLRDEVGRKRCKTCRQYKDESEFTTNTSGLKDGLSLHCRQCQAEARERAPMRIRESALKRMYGITVADYDRMYAEQGGTCAICRQPEKLVRRGVLQELSVDHCHATGRVRGLLCHDCNLGIGKLGEDSDRITAAAEYVRAGGRHAEQDSSTHPHRQQPAASAR